jgi:hypothetical protein
MGGTSSAGGVSMCWKQIFGDDVDLFSWDYGMTDGNFPQRMLHYGYRGGLSSAAHFPALIGVQVGGRSRRGREEALQKLESLGMSTFYGSDDLYRIMREGIPDTSGMSNDELAALPEYVRNFKCGGAIENGDPFCAKEKWTKYICTRRGKQTSWHPGWKDHAMIGHGLSLFIMQTLIEALTDLNEHETTDVDELLSQLRKEEDELFANFTAADLPNDYKTLFNVGEDLDPNFDLALFWKGPSLCHTSLTPSVTRYYGYVTNADKVGGFAVIGNETYDVGIQDTVAWKEPSNGVMRLVWEQGERERDCPVILKPDYKDIFFTGTSDGWAKLTFPNDAEKKAYNYQPSDFKGIIVIYLIGCPFGKCPKGHLAIDQYIEKKWEMKINGKPIVSLSDGGFDAIIPKSQDGIYFQPKEDGTYDIEIKVNEEKSFVKVTAFVLY